MPLPIERILRVRRQVSTSAPEMVPVAEMMLSGSRGIGSVAFNDINTIDVFDLEEDEDDDEDEEDSDVE